MTKLKTIKEHNEEILKFKSNQYLTGVACPNCKDELQYKNPGVIMLSYPGQAKVHCYTCQYETNIFVK